ncbi:bifunctional tRNA (5-methylaminomethyl-2-thiouridine)(34)-methyltransferase MnmD/FAD-dependent 5-carboxymethylaminomethyl-2-thiouridine(34) oxidoreductase MnmC [Marinobacterium sedimentorum]|uniref:bifunctional tRNA (5-methylaminomethyl-2-thiouridine)(34)-methyltransferase MnmD/FAD-dependent 5-carboxymethylaminomethyl-2-thiouridine(34) oxidoreductase MnmC n=1 Tax=Marinobacterium sedimentorum TaxID=2927804 RepID=UPI0020C5E6D4|nr:bifunctional tRNA (5-methylaminomethyl-2-thiouridine)(34)-methyltransferase MnmD/FAD-dependent 5-carboxymethylaminomethyl-2-thiouridine(34) oxidoreductase MnmC [Marinobacterium sedimentorum]
MTQLQHAVIDWHQHRAQSARFGEAYFNSDTGPADARHRFVDGNRLGARFAALTQPHFSIAEAGFGSGLNFLVTRQLWLQQAPSKARLNYIALEQYPLKLQDLARCLGHWPEFASAQLTAQYPPLLEGFHRLEFDNGRISLTLIFADATQGLSALEGPVDAWFLDGFSPATNPDLWSAALLQQVARLSHSGTTLAAAHTDSCVHEGLAAVGFEIRQAAGLDTTGRTLTGIYSGHLASDTPPVCTSSSPWFDRPKARPRPESVLILGAGLAGCCAAYALARRGIPVRLLERSGQVASGGSGNRQGALYAKLPVRPTKQGLLHSTGLDYSRHLLQELSAQGLLSEHSWQACGLLQLAQSDKEAKRQEQLLESGAYPATLVHGVSATQASTLAGSSTPHSGLFFPGAGWVSPVDLCQALLRHPLISLSTDVTVKALEYQQDSQRWQAQSDSGEHFLAAAVIVATAGAAKALSPLAQLPLKSIRGQVSEAPAPAAEPALGTVVCGDGYIAPAMNGTYCFGATFDLHDSDTDVRAQDHQSNLATLCKTLPALGAALAQQPLQGRVAFRCSTPDYLPIVGPAPDAERFTEDYGRLRQDRKWRFDTEPCHYPGLYVSVGHGSKGLLTCPIGGELLASLICNEPLPLGRTLTEALNPARFIIKNLIRGSI